jgi:hypothetical protein
LIDLAKLAAKYQERGDNEKYVFPEVGWELTDSEFFSRYKVALKGSYDPQSEIPWDLVKPEQYSEEEKIALRYFWSRLALAEYILVLADAKALQQAILQGYPTEIKQAVVMHLRDEWTHTDMTAEYARRLGGTLLTPVLLEKHKQFFAERLPDLERKLHPTFMRFSFGELTENFAHFGPLRSVRDPIASAIYNHIYTDEMRHGRTNWEWSSRGVGKGIGKLDEEDRVKAAELIPYGEKARRGWLIWGYHDLPEDEQDFHVACLRIAKSAGHTLFDAEEFLTTYEEQAKINYDKLLGKVKLKIDFN